MTLKKIGKKKVLMITGVAIVGLFSVWLLLQVVNSKPVKMGGGMYDRETNKFYSPEGMEKLNKSRGVR